MSTSISAIYSYINVKTEYKIMIFLYIYNNGVM